MAQSAAKEPAVRGRLPVARRDRRPALAALAVLLILLGALGSALIAFRSGDRSSVLVAADDIPVGKVLARSDFGTASISSDSRFLVPADALGHYLGMRAKVGVPSGSMLNPQMFISAQKQVPPGAQKVGIVVNTNQRPSAVPQPGDVVRVYFVPGSSQQSTTSFDKSAGQTVVRAARVVSVNAGRGSDASNVTVLVGDHDSGMVASLASTGNLALTVLPISTQPPVDLDTAR